MAKVVVAAESPAVRRILGSVLRQDGHQILTAADGVSAVQEIYRGQPDAVVLDVALPRLSGFAAARLLKDDWRTADIPLVLLTAPDATSDRYWAVRCGADRCLGKDFQARELTMTVAELAGRAGARRHPEPVQVGAEDLLARVGALLDRRLFEATVVGELTGVAAGCPDVGEAAVGLLSALGGFVDYDLAAVLLIDERVVHVAVARPASRAHYEELLVAVAEAAQATAELTCAVADLEVRVADPDHRLGSDEDRRMATFLSMPLRDETGRLIAELGLSSATANAFTGSTLAALRLLSTPAARVIAGARPAGALAG
jgi:CheY-like chemotaxis protein